MERNNIASLEQSILAVNSFYASSLNNLLRAECVVSINFHTEACCDASHVATYITESQDTELLALELCACLAIIEIAHSENQQSEYQFGNGVRILSRSVLSHHLMGCSCLEVDIIVACTCANYYFELLCCVEHLSVDFIRTDNHSISILNSVEELSFFCIFFKQHEFVACTFYYFFNTLYSSCCKRFFGCYEYFHYRFRYKVKLFRELYFGTFQPRPITPHEQNVLSIND